MIFTQTILLRGYSTMPWARAAFSFGIRSRTVRSSMIVFTATHSSSLKAEMVGRCKAGSRARTSERSERCTLSIRPTRPCASIAALRDERQVLQLGALRRLGEGRAVGDQLRVRLHHGIEDAQAVGAQRGPGLRRFDDRVREDRRLNFGRAPGELDLDLDALRLEVVRVTRRALSRWSPRSGRPHDLKRDSSGAASTHRTLPKLCLA